MSYEHCDKHNADATNGCVACGHDELREWVIHLDEVIRSAGGSLRGAVASLRFFLREEEPWLIRRPDWIDWKRFELPKLANAAVTLAISRAEDLERAGQRQLAARAYIEAALAEDDVACEQAGASDDFQWRIARRGVATALQKAMELLLELGVPSDVPNGPRLPHERLQALEERVTRLEGREASPARWQTLTDLLDARGACGQGVMDDAARALAYIEHLERRVSRLREQLDLEGQAVASPLRGQLDRAMALLREAPSVSWAASRDWLARLDALEREVAK